MDIWPVFIAGGVLGLGGSFLVSTVFGISLRRRNAMFAIATGTVLIALLISTHYHINSRKSLDNFVHPHAQAQQVVVKQPAKTPVSALSDKPKSEMRVVSPRAKFPVIPVERFDAPVQTPPPPRGNNADETETFAKRWPPSKTLQLEDWDDENLQIVFSTGCSRYQQWQADLLFFTHRLVGQKGKLTRLVSGCENHDTIYWGGISQDSFNTSILNRMADEPKYKVHVTPHFEGSNKCPFVNKPYSVHHWVEHGNHGNLDDQVVVIIDPDEMMMSQLSLLDRKLFSASNLFSSPTSKVSPVQPRRPVSQYYQIGSSWVKTHDTKPWVTERGHTRLTESLCGKDGECSRATEKEVWDHFSAGPPYFVHGQDIKAFSASWAEYTPALANVSQNSLYTEMWSYGIAAAEHDMPHTQLTNFMVSTPFANKQEAWIDWVDGQAEHGMSCHDPTIAEGVNIMPFLHFCQNIKGTDDKGVHWMWHKGHVPKNIYDCDLPIIKPPPDNFYNTQKPGTDKRSAWIICNLIANLNKFLTFYKTKFCPAPNLHKSVRMAQGEKIPRPCKYKEPWKCYQLAYWEEEEA
eukprot:m.262783 g.262783  ORF g.262783 m.262783 type:complete len:575 (+) comp46962_c0_seq1:24-1748(+)